MSLASFSNVSWTSLTEQVCTIKVGDPFDMYQGPQVSNTQFEVCLFNLIMKHTLMAIKHIMGYIASSQKDGATVHLGSKQIGREGYFIKPIIFILLHAS
jgi:acyl-CoA reductase-like NAD-dependent aldehyde dehydrogenase